MATTALALIGLFNVFGTYAAGSLGGRLPKRYLLSAIYALRSLAIVAFVLAPLTPWSVYVFASAMGFLWLSTVPLTNGIVAEIFGVRYLSMLGGFVFLSHQVGSFLGVWLGGRLYDATGSYDVVWWISIALGVFAAVGQPADPRAGDPAPGAGMKPARASPPGRRRRSPLARGLRRLPAAGPRGRPRQPHLGLLLTRRRRMAARARLRPGSQRWAHLSRRGGSVLDVAAGSGRHTRWLAARGHAVTAIDRDARGDGAARRASPRSSSPTSKARRGRSPAAASTRSSSPTTSGGRCCPIVAASLAPGGVLLYETFAAGNETVGRPARPDFLLAPGELLAAAAGLRIVAYEDGFLSDPERFVQRLAAVREPAGDAARAIR